MRTNDKIQSTQSVMPKTKDFWERGEAGKAYDKEFGDLIGWYVNQSELRPVADLTEDIRNARVLDVGCGTGRHLMLFHPSNKRYGIDLSAPMMAEAKAKVPDGIFTVASADALPFENESFDVVISSRVLQHIRDQQKVISEMARVCKRGGQIILLSYNSWSLLCLYKQIRLSKVGKIINLPFKLILGKRSFFNPWGFEYDNYCSIPELTRYLKNVNVKVTRSWGATCGLPWFLNDFFIGKILAKTVPFLLKAFLSFCLFLDRTLIRIFPLKFFPDKVIVVGKKV